MKGRAVIEYRLTGDLAWISHLETVRMLERFFRKSGIFLKYSEGFNPHPKILVPVSKGIGIEGNREYAEFSYEESSPEAFGRLTEECRETVSGIVHLADNEKSIMSRFDSVQYFFENLTFANGFIPEEFPGVVCFQEKNEATVLGTSSNFSFSKFSRETSFRRVRREVILK